jgi:hypothetical protein
VSFCRDHGRSREATFDKKIICVLCLLGFKEGEHIVDPRGVARVHLLVCFTRAREAPSSGASRPTRRCADATDPIEPALRLPADLDVPDSFSQISFSRSRLGANDGARAVSGDGEVANDAEVDGAVSVLAWSGRRRAPRATGSSIKRDQILQHCH